jgi:uncharacterized protein YaiE (UPF0345 family)
MVPKCDRRRAERTGRQRQATSPSGEQPTDVGFVGDSCQIARPKNQSGDRLVLKHNSYFDGNVQSVGFDRNGRSMTVGAMAPGEYHFNTAAPERMTVVSGELRVKLPGDTVFTRYPCGTCFEVPGQSGFDLEVSAAAAYVCEFL